MKRKLVIVGVLLVLLAILTSYLLRSDNIVFPSEIRYGMMKRTGESKNFSEEKELKITNKTTKEIKIGEIYVSCSCLFISDKFKRVLSPGETVSLKTKMTLNENESIGRIVDIRVTTNHEQYAQIKIKALGVVEPAFYSYPEEIDFGQVIYSEEKFFATAYITIFNNEGKGFSPPRVWTKSKAIQVSLSKKHAPKKVLSVFGDELSQNVSEYSITLVPKHQVDIRKENKEIIFCSLPDGRNFEIPVKWINSSMEVEVNK
jgi:hypothetical protein